MIVLIDKTLEDVFMKKTLFTLLSAVLVLVLILPSALAAGELKVQSETLVVVPSYSDTFYGNLYAEVKNTGDAPVQLANGLYELFDKDGKVIKSDEYINMYPSVLNPGENGFILLSELVDEAKTKDYIASHKLTVTGTSSIDYKVERLAASDAKYEIVEDYSKRHVLSALVKNDKTETANEPVIVFALKDDQGKVIYTIGTSTYNVGIPAGNTVLLKATIDDGFVKYMEENNIKPATLEAIAYTEAYN